MTEAYDSRLGEDAGDYCGVDIWCFVCIEALNKRVQGHHPSSLGCCGALNLFGSQPTCNFSFLGRLHVEDGITKRFTGVVKMLASRVEGDNKGYLEMRLEADAGPNALGDELRAGIREEILEIISEIFLLVSPGAGAI